MGKSQGRLSVRLATTSDIAGVKTIADGEKASLGFIIRGALERAVAREGLLVAELDEQIVGFCHLYRRRDGIVTIYHLAVAAPHRRLGIGRQLVESVCRIGAIRDASLVRLKCPEDLEANVFYAQLGFHQTGEASGRSRQLTRWERTVSRP